MNQKELTSKEIDTMFQIMLDCLNGKCETELQVYPTNDGRMKYEMYVKVKE